MVNKIVRNELAEVLHRYLAATRAGMDQAVETLLLEWWKVNQTGGMVYVTTWRYEGEMWVCLCASPSQEDQVASSPGNGALWISCTAWDLPGLN
ncbi:hypothetical protein UFOVP777_26 [uncultured Caudovirales phage]|uniref:Uncharacterized protein n=1 Tax=uncultured Caudovirales phage TaxID=2100421 RepID=A0A6J5NYQ0_9CAUD|nr:hypothetical protein UFOVP777_26 [uncultured Caudovirales phage]